MEIFDPTETRSVHIKTYVEPSMSTAIEVYRKHYGYESTSSAVRQLILTGLENVEQKGFQRKINNLPDSGSNYSNDGK